MNRAVSVAFVAVAACSGGSSGTNVETDVAQMPTESTLCKVWMGYDATVGTPISTPVYGTNSDDVRAVLGEPAKRTDTEFTYNWCVGSSCAKHVTATLTFAKADRCYVDTGKPIMPPYWLSDIRVDGADMPKCWHEGSEDPKLCTECIPQGEIGDCK